MTGRHGEEDQKIAFITGAASGIGRATAELFAAQGWWIGAADRNAGGLEELRDALGKERCRPWHLDVTDKAAVARSAAEADRLGIRDFFEAAKAVWLRLHETDDPLGTGALHPHRDVHQHQCARHRIVC